MYEAPSGWAHFIGVDLPIIEPGNVKRVQGVAEKAYGIDRGEIVYHGELEGILRDEKARQRIWVSSMARY